jgi:hypothetical protein
MLCAGLMTPHKCPTEGLHPSDDALRLDVLRSGLVRRIRETFGRARRRGRETRAERTNTRGGWLPCRHHEKY